MLHAEATTPSPQQDVKRASGSDPVGPALSVGTPAEAVYPVPVAGLLRQASTGITDPPPDLDGDPLGGRPAPSGIPEALRRRSGTGAQLPASLADAMGQHLGLDLSHVRVHADQEADTISRTLQAKAFTHGSDIYFSAGTYAPDSAAGQHLLAHELTHVAQGAEGSPLSGLTVGRADDPAEAHAEASATRMMQALRRSFRAGAAATRTTPEHEGAVVRRLTSAAAYPVGAGKKYKDVDKLHGDVDERVTALALAQGSTFAVTNDGADGTLTVPIAGPPAPDNATVTVTFANVTTDPYVPSDFVLTKTTLKSWTATIKIHQQVAPANLKPVVQRELNEMAFRVKAAADNGGTEPVGDAARAVFVDGATPLTAVPTSNDRATAADLKDLWTEQKGLTPRVLAALKAAGLGEPHLLPETDQKFVQLKAAGVTAEMITDLVSGGHLGQFTAANAPLVANIELKSDLIGHLIAPEYRPNQFATAGLTGGHLDPTLKSFLAGHAAVHFVEVAAVGDYTKYLQYKWTGGGPMPALPDRPKKGATLPPDWVEAKDNKGAPLPKSTFKDLHVFLKDAIKTFTEWAAANDALAKVAAGNFGLSNAAPVSATTGQAFGGYFNYNKGKGKWTINTIFPIL